MILDAVPWLRTFSTIDTRRWCLVGKGPTFGLRKKLKNLRDYMVFGLNHVCQYQRTRVTHICDVEVLGDVQESLPISAGILIMPWHPHEKMLPSKRTLLHYAEEYPILGDFIKQGRLWSYNRQGLKLAPNRQLSEVPLRMFSSVAGLNLLASAGVRNLYTLGIDGGTEYADCFDPKDRLANGHPSYDGQTVWLQRTIRQCKLTVTALQEDSPSLQPQPPSKALRRVARLPEPYRDFSVLLTGEQDGWHLHLYQNGGDEPGVHFQADWPVVAMQAALRCLAEEFPR